MNDARRKLSLLLQVVVGMLLAVVLLVVVLLTAGDYLRPLWWRFVSESDPEAGRPPPEAFERFQHDQDAIAIGADLGPLRCSLAPWKGNGEHPNLRLSLTNTSANPVTIWYHTWPHAHVTFLVRDKAGIIAASFHWGTLSSQAVGIDATGKPTTKVPTRTLKVGETYTAGFYLTSLRDYLDVPPGCYRVEAVFIYHDLGGWPDGEQHFVTRSNAVEIVVELDSDKKPSWRLH